MDRVEQVRWLLSSMNEEERGRLLLLWGETLSQRAEGFRAWTVRDHSVLRLAVRALPGFADEEPQIIRAVRDLLAGPCD